MPATRLLAVVPGDEPSTFKAVEALAALCGTSPQPMDHAAGGFTFHLHSRKAKAFDLLRVHSDFLERGGLPSASSPQEFGAFLQAETAKWTSVVKQAQIKLED